MDIIFTNWRRKNNLQTIVYATVKQTYTPNIIVVDNASQDGEHKFTTNISGQVLNRDNSNMCWERWLVAFNSVEQYVCIMDDDICFAKNNVLENCVNYMNKNPNVDAIGAYGVKYNPHLTYFQSEHTYCKHKDVPVSILKGRFMVVRTERLKGIDKTAELTCDDIKVSAFLKTKILPGCIVNSFADLPEGGVSLSSKSYQSLRREYAAKMYFR